MKMRKLLLSTAPVWLTLFWATAPPIHAQPTIVAASSPFAKYIYAFSGAIQVQFGATDLLPPGGYNYTGLPFPPNGGGTPFPTGSVALSLSSSGVWIFSSRAGPLFIGFFLTPSVPQLPAVGTNIVYDELSVFLGQGGNAPAAVTLTVSQVPPPGVPAPGTLLLIVCGFGGLALLAPKTKNNMTAEPIR